jgi:flagellar hook-basal body complex protein FliE
MSIENIGNIGTSEITNNKISSTAAKAGGNAFAQKLQSALNDVNEMQVKSDKAMSDIATGQVKDLHQAALAIDKAEISMKLMLEVRNKALSAYKEISRTQI